MEEPIHDTNIIPSLGPELSQEIKAIKDQAMENELKGKTLYTTLGFSVSVEEKNYLTAVMDKLDYPSMSSFLRDITMRGLPYMTRFVYDKNNFWDVTPGDLSKKQVEEVAMEQLDPVDLNQPTGEIYG